MRHTLCALAVLAFATGCEAESDVPAAEPPSRPEAEVRGEVLEAEPVEAVEVQAPDDVDEAVVAPIVARSGAGLTGTVRMLPDEDGVRVIVEVQNAPPGLHGVHVHENPDCSAPDASSAGGHYAPFGRVHGLPTEREHHLGDLGNMHVHEDGSGYLEIVAEGANVEPGDRRSFLGRSLVVHAQADQGTQPAGDAGGRIGCAVIGAEPAESPTARPLPPQPVPTAPAPSR